MVYHFFSTTLSLEHVSTILLSINRADTRSCSRLCGDEFLQITHGVVLVTFHPSTIRLWIHVEDKSITHLTFFPNRSLQMTSIMSISTRIERPIRERSCQHRSFAAVRLSTWAACARSEIIAAAGPGDWGRGARVHSISSHPGRNLPRKWLDRFEKLCHCGRNILL